MKGIHRTPPILSKRSQSQDSQEEAFSLPMAIMDNTVASTPPRKEQLPDLVNSPSCSNQSLAGSNHSDITRDSYASGQQQQLHLRGPAVPNLIDNNNNNNVLATIAASPESPKVFEKEETVPISPMREIKFCEDDKNVKTDPSPHKEPTKSKSRPSSPRKHNHHGKRETVAVVFNDDFGDGEVVARSLSVSGCNVVVILKSFNTLVASSLLKIPRVTVLVLDSTDTKKFMTVLEGIDRAIMMTKYWEKFESKREERKALALITACHRVGVSQIIMSTVENVRPLKKRGIPSQVSNDQLPTFAGMKKVRRVAKKTKVQVLHMITSYRDYTKSDKSMCLLSAGKGTPVVIRSHSLAQEAGTPVSSPPKVKKSNKVVPFPVIVPSPQHTEDTELVSPMSSCGDERSSSSNLGSMVFAMASIMGAVYLMMGTTTEPQLENVTKTLPVIETSVELMDGAKHEIGTSFPAMVLIVSYIMGSTWVICSNGLIPASLSSTAKTSIMLLTAYGCAFLWNPQQQYQEQEESLVSETMNATMDKTITRDPLPEINEDLPMIDDQPAPFKTMSFELMLSVHAFVIALTALAYICMSLFVRAPMKTLASAYLIIMGVTTLPDLLAEWIEQK
mmetsp:Transcript_5681/g.8756  ORF Transcript_5681/g.8756 Transcript_5681/m.8756 type:complete len:618 (-) Transcript_5681:272-2125(-)|eukprot:CAMPEP_0195289240 /NCGR_PEP_ID=MMETSP0707-20130614/5602_1 /TAXON_ID=33640 /ORGANISM="Asterionellopsis glacialis, Strain CCMP134" /LENGTH=617 /DNA_ID=CAMNT_0040349223 /DNA_START=480 /DNA_END=2333 /DNA_ORIENTATION=+